MTSEHRQPKRKADQLDIVKIKNSWGAEEDCCEFQANLTYWVWDPVSKTQQKIN